MSCWHGYLSGVRCKWLAWSSWCHCHIVSCFIKIQTGLTFLVPAYPGCPGKEAIKRVSVCLSYNSKKQIKTRMWANVQRDGRPAEYRWCSLLNAAKFGWRPLLECRAVTMPRRESRWNLQGCPKLANRSQPLGGRSSPHYKDMWGRYRCLTSFFSDCRYMPQLRRYSRTKLCDGANMAIFCVLYFQWAACSTFQTCILNMH